MIIGYRLAVNEELRTKTKTKTNARKATSDVKLKMPLRGGLDRAMSLTGIDYVKTITKTKTFLKQKP